ncbi:hypothetical protein J0H58_10090, partial [bacterium]|nr:hypothetical protein [bacterium]
ATELEAARLTAVAEIEFAALPCVAWAACRGVALDRGAWQALAVEADAERARLREALDAAAPDGATLFGTRNWDSPDDVKAALAAVGVELEATDDDALAAVAHPLAERIRDYRSVARLATTYGRDWLRHVAPDGRVYATWKQIGAGASGRMSCKGPNLQQLPRDEAAARQCDLSERTVYTRLKDPDFQRRVKQVRTDMVRRSAGLLSAASGEAVRTLLALIGRSWR